MTLIVLLCTTSVYSQITAIHFNAAWNEPNKAEWVGELTDCEITYVDITASPKLQQKYNVVVVPTIIVLKDGEEIKITHYNFINFILYIFPSSNYFKT